MLWRIAAERPSSGAASMQYLAQSDGCRAFPQRLRRCLARLAISRFLSVGRYRNIHTVSGLHISFYYLLEIRPIRTPMINIMNALLAVCNANSVSKIQISLSGVFSLSI
jgi:hypothetical protein